MAVALARRRLLRLLLALLASPVAGLPKHSKFQVAQGGVLESVERPDLRINVMGGQLNPGDPLVLWPCSAQGHESFELSDGLIRLGGNRAMCLNAGGGVNAGTPIMTWPCAQHGRPEAHEEFTMGPDGRIRLLKHPDMCINIKGGHAARGSELVLWPCGGGIPGDGSVQDGAMDEFEFKDQMIKVKGKPDFHFNVRGGVLSNSSQVVLWDCQPAPHEMFEFTFPDRRLKSKAKPDMCVNAKGGVQMGSQLIVWPCAPEPEPNELFMYNERTQTIQVKGLATLTFNVKGANYAPGGEIILWTTDEYEL